MDVRRAHVVVSLAVAATFARGLRAPLQTRWDDGRFVLDNPLAREVSLSSLVSIFTETHFQAYHPLHLLAYWLDVPWTDADPFALHLTGLALWVLAANALLRAMLALGLVPGAAALATLAYALHPVQVEAVTWASGRKDALAAAFAFGAVALHVGARTWLDARAWLARACFLCAALSKTSALPLPAVLLLADVLLRRQPLRDAVRMQIPSFAVAAALAPVVLSTWRDAEMIRQSGSFAAPLVRALNTLAHQFGTALWPSATSPMYSTAAFGDARASTVAGIVGLALVLGLAWRARARRALFVALGFLVLLAPVANVVPLYFPWQDRYLSLPLFALAFGLGAAVEHATRGRAVRGAHVAAAAVVAVLGLRTVQYQGEWQSEARLWGHAASTQPDAYYAWLKLCEVRRETGQLHGAVRACERLLGIDPQRRLGHAALAQARAALDERRFGLTPSRAEAYARELYDVLDDAAALRALASQMLASGHLGALEVPLARALALEPYPDDALERAALVQVRGGRPSVARFYLARMRTPTRNPELVGLLRGTHRGAGPVVP